MFSKQIVVAAAITYFCWWMPPIAADTIILKSGGQIEGQLLNPGESPRQHFIVATQLGGKVTLAANQVRKILSKTSVQQQYELLAGRMHDTVDDHWKMAEWCLQNDLLSKRQLHLQRVLEIDPNHVESRKALGFHHIQGKWTRPKEWMQNQGYVYYKSRWLTQQDFDRLQQREQAEFAAKQCRRQIKMWRGWIGGRLDQKAREKMRAVNDVKAAPAFAGLLEKEKDNGLKRLYIDVLSDLGGPQAIAALIRCSLQDPSEAIRDRCLVELVRHRSPVVMSSFIKTLNHKDNKLVNRAAAGLAQMTDMSAALPLINALETEHKYIVQQQSGGINPTFGTGGGGLNVGGGPKLVKHKRRNEEVLVALVELTGMNFSFDRQRWLNWYGSRQAPADVNLRRDL
ncbi:MAG: hypothetical protein CMJ81_18645 [Planctomycetaceae bacterium]|nr:hypothetical protein [Planctomycetaceae bacterium]MBP62721.1 hypothetical protein [Planctomycetaceae bacterium]